MPRLPAEWEPQAAVMLTWPHAGTDWAERLAAIESLYVELAAQIAGFEPVLVVCQDALLRGRVAGLLDAAGVDPGRLQFALAASNDTWARDHGPITVFDEGGARLVDFRFNGWGGKFPAERDDRITATLDQAGVFGATPRTASELVVEGGAIECDGQGTLLAMQGTLVDERRNPGLDRSALEVRLSALFGTTRYLWLTRGQLSGDDTDGHIDTLARFCAADAIAYVHSEDAEDPDHAGLVAMEAELRGLRQAGGRPYRLVGLPQPRPIHNADGERLAASYANFLIVNQAVLAPVYGDPADRVALEVLARLFPARRILPLDCRAVIEQGGSLHCLTMQLPAGLPLSGLCVAPF